MRSLCCRPVDPLTIPPPPPPPPHQTCPPFEQIRRYLPTQGTPHLSISIGKISWEVRAKAYTGFRDPVVDQLFKPREGPSAYEEDVRRVHLDKV